MKMLTYEFDQRKSTANLRKHRVSFDEAVSVFEGDLFAYTDFDPDHSATEKRFFTIGISIRGRFLFISHNEADGRIRIISARRAKPEERRLYEGSNS